MKSIAILACAAFLAVATTGALAAPPAKGSVSVFVGFTDDATNALPDTIDGLQGMLAMHALCQDDFGPNARMCTSEEFWLSPNAEAPLADAWFHSASQYLNIDFTGFGNANANCGGWIGPFNGLGYVVTTDGKVGRPQCGTLRPVTCCARR